MLIASTDTETTGLDPKTCQILEVGIVVEDTKKRLPYDKLPRFHCYVVHREMKGNPYALALNAEIIKKISRHISKPGSVEGLFLEPQEVARNIAAFLSDNGFGKKITAAGKNFASFDALFLNELPGFSDLIRFHHRSVDPALLYFDDNDEELPGLKPCMERAGLEGEVAHTAVEDAIMVIKLLRIVRQGVLA